MSYNIKTLVSSRNALEMEIKGLSKILREKRKKKKEYDKIISDYMEKNNLPGLKCEFSNQKKNAIIPKKKIKRAYVNPNQKKKECKNILKNAGVIGDVDEILNQILETSKGPKISHVVLESKKLKN